MGNCCSSESNPAATTNKTEPTGAGAHLKPFDVSGVSIKQVAGAQRAKHAGKSKALADVQIFAACADGQQTMEMTDGKAFELPAATSHAAVAGGACTNAIFDVLLRRGGKAPLRAVLTDMTGVLLGAGYKSFAPQLSTLAPVDLDTTEFSFDVKNAKTKPRNVKSLIIGAT